MRETREGMSDLVHAAASVVAVSGHPNAAGFHDALRRLAVSLAVLDRDDVHFIQSGPGGKWKAYAKGNGDAFGPLLARGDSLRELLASLAATPAPRAPETEP